MVQYISNLSDKHLLGVRTLRSKFLLPILRTESSTHKRPRLYHDRHTLQQFDASTLHNIEDMGYKL